MDVAKSMIYPLNGSVLVWELVLRGMLLGIYVYTKMLDPHHLSVASPSEYLAYAHPHKQESMISARLLYKLVSGYSLIAGLCGILYARLVLRVEGRALLSSFMYYALAASLALVLTAVTTNVLKVFGGRMRPDFLARCLPSLYRATQLPHFAIMNAAGQPLPPFNQSDLICEPSSPYDVSDGRKSFPSGHSSYAASVATVAAVYLHQVAHQTPSYRVALKSLLAIVLSCACVVFPMVVGITRVIDRRHHPSDVIAGLALGAFNGCLSGYLYFADPLAIPRKADDLTASLQSKTVYPFPNPPRKAAAFCPTALQA